MLQVILVKYCDLGGMIGRAKGKDQWWTIEIKRHIFKLRNAKTIHLLST
jgi:hypothetical protein